MDIKLNIILALSILSGQMLGIVGTPQLKAVVHDHTVELTWTPSTTQGVTYSVFKGTSSGGESTTPVVSNLNSLNWTDTDVVSGSTYWYYIESCTASCSSSSNEVSATIP